MSQEVTESTDEQTDQSTNFRFQQALESIPRSVTVTKSIIATNVLVFVVMVSSGVSFLSPTSLAMLSWGANFGPKTMNGEWWRLVTYMFLHSGIVHLGLNMFVLWGLGQITERFVGRTGFFMTYLFSGFAGGIASLAWRPTGISVGASGAVFGIAGLLLGFIILRRDTIPSGVRNQLLKSMFGFLVLNTAFGLAVSRIDTAAHIGGLVAGTFSGLLLSQPIRNEMVAQRRSKNLIMLSVSAIVFCLAIIILPTAHPDVTEELKQFKHVEKAAYEKSFAFAELFRTGQLQPIEYADRVENEIRKPWSETRKRMEQLVDLEYVNRGYIKSLILYLQAREESWRLLIQGLRENDQSAIDRSTEYSKAADAMTMQMDRSNPQPSATK